MKKIISIILSILLIMSCISSPAFAGESADEFVIVEPGVMPAIESRAEVSMDEKITLDDIPTLKYTTTGNVNNQLFMPTDADFTQYDNFHITLYSPKATNDNIGVILRQPAQYSELAIPVDWEGWKTIDIPLTKFPKLDKSAVYRVEFWDQGWNFNYGDAIAGSDKNGSLNIGKIWLSKDTDYIIRDTDIAPARGNTCSFDNELTFDGNTTMKWKTEGVESQIVYNITRDISSYSTFNVQIYSPKSTNDTIGIHFHTSKPYASKTIVVDWEGWKTIQIPMSDYSSITLSEVVTFQMWDHGWSYTFGDAVSGSDKAGSLNIGKIWLDNSEIETPDEPDTPPVIPDEPIIPDEPEDEENEGEYIIAKYDSKFSFGGKLSKDTENVYEQDASAKWDVRTGNNFGYDVSDCNFSDYAFIYATVYSPKSTGSVIMFQYLYEGSGYAQTVIPLNFEGWKTLAFPVANIGIGGNKVKKFNVYNNGWTNKIEDIEYINFERIWLSKYDINSCEVITSSLTDGYNRVSPVDFSITLGTTSTLDPDVLPEIVLKGEFGKEIACDVKISGSKLKISATETLGYSENHTLSVTGITSKTGYDCVFETSFKTHSFAVTALTPGISQENGKVVASTTAINPTESEKEAILWIGEYSSDGKLVGIKKATLSIPGADSKGIEAELDMVSSENTVEAFVTDASGRPIVPFVAVLGSEENAIVPSVGGSGELTLKKATPSSTGIKADVMLNTEFAAPVVAFIRNSDGEAVYAKAAMTDSKGKVFFDILLSSDELASGEYTLSVYCEQSKNAAEYDFYFLNTDSKKYTFDEITSASTVDKAADLIEENHEAFNFSKEFLGNHQTAKFLAEVIGGNEPSDFDALATLMDKALELRDEINYCDWNKLPEIIEENYDILLCSELKSEFSNLGGEQKAKVCKKLKENCPYELFSDFANNLEDSIEEVKFEKDKKPSSGGGGGGGGGSSYSVPLTPTSGDVAPDTNENKLPFNDLASVSWATESIVSLYNQGIISSSSNGNFRPNDNITREEFAKLLCVSFGFENASASCDFEDVAKDAWYYGYVASLCEKGIITGYGKSFGTGDLITREDMAVMALRALNLKGKSLNSDSDKFSDDGVISDYAKTSVYSLKNAGIINGMGDGSFAPKSGSTRAQAAKIISGLIGLIN